MTRHGGRGLPTQYPHGSTAATRCWYASASEQAKPYRSAISWLNCWGCPDNAVALTRCASDALQSLIRNYNRLQPGDQVLLSDLEYDTVKSAMRWLARHRGVEVIEIPAPAPCQF